MVTTHEPVSEALQHKFFKSHPTEAALYLEKLAPTVAAGIIEQETPDNAVPIFESLSPARAADIVNHVSEQFIQPVLKQLSAQRLAALFAQLEEALRARLLALLDPKTKDMLEKVLSYPADSAGAIMDRDVIMFRAGLTVREALARLVAKPHLHKRRALFVVDDRLRLKGLVDIQALALADRNQMLSELMYSAVAVVNDTDNKQMIAETFERYRVTGLPVIDYQGSLMGVIRYEDLVSVSKETATVDIQTMVGASKDERALSTPWFAIRKRLPWLQVNLLTAFLAAAVVGLFESTIAAYTALAVLLPVVAGQSGNTGSQALAVTMRGLALREVYPQQWGLIAFKEARVALVNGIVVAVVTSVGTFIWSQSLGLALIIGSSMVISMLIAGIAGAMVPITLSKLGQDPAQSSSIILTTITDVAGFFSFLGIATLLMFMLL